MAVNYPVEAGDDDVMLSEINTTPLVDVMLVLLIIFLITIPVVSASVGVSLPREFNQLNQARPDNVIISITASNATFWYDLPLPDRAELQARLKALGARQPQPEVHIRADARLTMPPWPKWCWQRSRRGLCALAF